MDEEFDQSFWEVVASIAFAVIVVVAVFAFMWVFYAIA
jgi:heme/copper-type cytochrome/quinol oxidase subunit 4